MAVWPLALALLMAASVAPASAQWSAPDFTPFDEAGAEFPEGVAVDKVGNTYVSMDQLGQVWRIAPSGERMVVHAFGSPGAVGLAVDAQGSVFVARGAVGGLFSGVWKIDPAGDATLVPGTDAIALPNALAFDDQGNLYITETFSLDDPQPYDCPMTTPILPTFGQGGVWRVPRGGVAEPWFRGEETTGLCVTPVPYPVGANGIAYRQGALFVVNSEKATVVRIPVTSDGSAGTAQVAAHVDAVDPDFGPAILDGIALDVHGSMYVAVINHSAVVRISPDGATVETLADEAQMLDWPTSLAFGTGKSLRQTLFVTNLAYFVPGGAGPGLVALDVGVPGQPLP